MVLLVAIVDRLYYKSMTISYIQDFSSFDTLVINGYDLIIIVFFIM